jgi:hypothetical protein
VFLDEVHFAQIDMDVGHARIFGFQQETCLLTPDIIRSKMVGLHLLDLSSLPYHESLNTGVVRSHSECRAIAEPSSSVFL